MNIEQLLEDQTFVNWAKQSNQSDIAKWETWRKQHPEHSGLMEEARLMITGIDFNRKKVSESEKADEWEKLTDLLDLPNESAEIRKLPRRRWLAIAASVAILLVGGWSLSRYFQTPEQLVFQTAFGEIKHLELPDGSSVTLNANSTLAYPEFWNSGELRQVKLTGEAFFEVKKKSGNEAFIVNAGETVVRVLGTSFNVNARQSASVSLIEGKVQLTQKENTGELILNPGETAQFDKKNNQFIFLNELTEQSISWKDHIWSFQKTPLPEVLQRIEDEFGLKSELGDTSLLQREISGKISTQNKEMLFRALETLLDVRILNEGEKLKWMND